MDSTGQQSFATPLATSDPSNPTSPVESFADGITPVTGSPSQNHNGQQQLSHHPNPTSPRPQTHPAYPGASVYTPTDIPSERLNPRSCVTCRRRKVRCDKHMPCSNCRRAQIPCIFPAPGRAPRRPRVKDPNAPPKQPSSEREIELMKRLRKLEGIVEELSGQIEVETARNQSSSGNSPEATVNNGTDSNHPTGPGPRVDRADSVTAQSQGSPSTPGDPRTMSPYNFNANNSSKLLQRQESVNKKFGRLVINDHGKTRYVSSAFWSKITDEVSMAIWRHGICVENGVANGLTYFIARRNPQRVAAAHRWRIRRLRRRRRERDSSNQPHCWRPPRLCFRLQISRCRFKITTSLALANTIYVAAISRECGSYRQGPTRSHGGQAH